MLRECLGSAFGGTLGGPGQAFRLCGICEPFSLERWERPGEVGLPDSGATGTPKTKVSEVCRPQLL